MVEIQHTTNNDNGEQQHQHHKKQQRTKNSKKVRIGITHIIVIAFGFTVTCYFFVARHIVLPSNGNARHTTNSLANEKQQAMGKGRGAPLPLIGVPEPRSQRKKHNINANNNKNNIDNNVDTTTQNLFHFIVSSDCTSYQRWEVLTQLHSAQTIHQCGKFTWIVSGCLDHGDETSGKGKGGAQSDVLTPSLLLEEVERHFPQVTVSNDGVVSGMGRSVGLARDNSLLDDDDDDDGDDNDEEEEGEQQQKQQTKKKKKKKRRKHCHTVHPHIHFTPDYSNMALFGGPYADGKRKRTFINRQNKTLYGNFGNIYKFNNKPNGLNHWIMDYMEKGEDDNDDEAIVLIDPDFLFLNKFGLGEGVEMVRPGKPAAAKYGLGGQFLDFNLTRICDRAPNSSAGAKKSCPFGSISNYDVNHYYSAGAPYIIHIQDVLALSYRWSELVPPTYDEYPLLYAEMFAYSMAAADLNLKHNLIKGLFTGCMTAWPHTHEEEEHKALQLSAKTYANLMDGSGVGGALAGGKDAVSEGASSCFLPPLTPPPFLHYCQRYMFVTPYSSVENHSKSNSISEEVVHFFAKRRVDHDILDCSHDGPLEPFVDEKPGKMPPQNEKDWNVLAVCATVRAINYAKTKGCPMDGTNNKLE